MVELIYNHKDHSVREKTSISRGLLHYHKDSKEFSCDASDLQCAGLKNPITNLASEFTLRIEENNHTKNFMRVEVGKSDEGEIQYWYYRTYNAEFGFIIFND